MAGGIDLEEEEEESGLELERWIRLYTTHTTTMMMMIVAY